MISSDTPHQNSRYYNTGGNRHSQKLRNKHPLEINKDAMYSDSDCNATSNTIFIRKPGRNTFKAPNYLPPKQETTIVYKAHEYLPPIDNSRRPIVTSTKQPSIVTRPQSTISRKTKKPFYTWTQTRNHNTMTTIPYYSYIPTVKHVTTKGPYYIPVTKPPGSTNHAAENNNNDVKINEYDPAMAMEVPFEDEETLIPVTVTEKPGDPNTGFTGELNVVLLQTTPKMRPVDRVGSERGDVPYDYEDMPIVMTTKSDEPAPAMANPVPTEPEDESPTVASTIKSPTTTSILSSTTNKFQTITTLENKRHLLEKSTTPSYKAQTTTPKTFKGSEYLNPKTPTTETVSATTPPNRRTPGTPAPALAMYVPTPTEPEDFPLVPSSTPATTSTSSKITTKTIDNNRHIMDVETASTTLMNEIQTTTVIPFKGQEYLPPKGTAKHLAIVSSAVGPVDVPPEPDDLPTPSPSTLTTSNDTFRAAETSTSTIVPDTSAFKAPEYLPPTAAPSPLPAIAMKVPPEPECDPESDNPKIDQRSFINHPCVQNTSKPVTPFKGPPYLPPLPKTRVERSSNRTLSLRDLEGTPRPVWYAGVYKKTTEPPYPICGGSIVREDVVISAAHCFWDDKDSLQSSELFAVAARKIYKRFNHPMDKRAQKSDVASIKVPPRFLGAKTSFQDDIAVLRLATPFVFTPSVSGLRPICVNFDVDFEREQMKDGHMGTVAGWGYTDASGTGTRVLLWLELPYVEIEKCILSSERSFLKYITCDKVCAGENDTGKALCRGDSGGGLAFWQGTPEHATPYLRGVASTAPSRRDAECNVFAYGSFTHVRAHRTFLRDHVPDIEECRFWE